MEHRCNQRSDLDVNVQLRYRGETLASGRAKNGSTTGLFVETGCLTLELQQPIDVEMVFEGIDENVRVVYESRVVRKDLSGLGIKIDAVKAEIFSV